VLTPMQVQYLVGLCCLRRDPAAVDIVVGDLVQDTAAEKERDVDLTVTMRAEDGSISAFKGYEAKREGPPLDVTSVEQLCLKLKDMPSLTHRSIVSASGYTSSAIRKAAAHQVSLYTLRPWERPMHEQFKSFPDIGRPEDFFAGFQTVLLYWIDARLNLQVPRGPASFNVEDSAKVFKVDGKPHGAFSTFNEYKNALLRRSTGILFSLPSPEEVRRTFPLMVHLEGESFSSTPAWPHTHTIDVREDQVYLRLDGGFFQLALVTVSGYLQWRRETRVPEFYIMENVSSQEVFAAATVASYGIDDGRMFAMVFRPDSREANVHQFELLEKHKNAIRRLRIPTPASDA
jgi:hypothetical protein